MSKYKYEFYIATRYVGSKVTDVIDLVDDYLEEEAVLDVMSDTELELHVQEHFNAWVEENTYSSFNLV